MRPAISRAVSFSNYFSVRAPAQKKRAHLPQVRLREDTRHALPIVIAVGIAGAVGLLFAVIAAVSGALDWSDVAGTYTYSVAATNDASHRATNRIRPPLRDTAAAARLESAPPKRRSRRLARLRGCASRT